MENAIPSMIIGAILLTAISVLGRGSLAAQEDMGMGLRAMEYRIVEKTSTRLSIANVTVDASGDFLTFDLLNEGQTRIAAFERLDVIINYYDSPTTQISTWLPYAEPGPTLNAWTLGSIQGDGYEPGILNPGETAQIRIDVDPAIASGQTNSLVISTELGSITEAVFTS